MGLTTRRTHTTLASSLAILALSTRSSATLNAMTYKGCFSTSTPLTDNGFYQYQTSGYCQPICVGQNDAVLATSNGSDCWCGGQLPAGSTKVDDSKCDTPCNGFGDEKCGGNGFWSVYLTGLTTDVTQYNGAVANSPSESGSTTSTSTSSTATSTSSSTILAPSIVTSISPGNTVVITVSATPTSTTDSNTSSGSSTAGVAAGVVVGVVVVAALLGGIFFLLRRRRRQRGEENYKRSAQVSDFMSAGGKRNAPMTAYSQMSDARLDPEHGRRNSVGSMADEHDYSRRILRVANPDSH